MSFLEEYFKKIIVGRHISDLPKSKLPASAAVDNGKYPFICSSAVIKHTDILLQTKPAIVMGTGGIATVNLGKNEFSYSTDTWGFRSNDEEIPTDYLFRKVQQYLPRIDYAAFEGSGLKHLRKDYVRSLLFEVPKNIKVSNKILEILSIADQAIEKTETLIGKLQQIRAGLMYDLFTRGIADDGQLRTSREYAPELYKETSVGWIPKDWKLGGLLDVTDQKRQAILTGPFGADLSNSDFVEEGVALLRIGNVQSGYLFLDDLLYVTEKKAKALQKYKVKTDDLLFARQGATTGRNCLADSTVNGFLINYHIIRVALDHELCAPLFIEAAFNEWAVKSQIERDKGRGTREGINTKQLTKLKIPLPSFVEQQEIAKVINKHKTLINVEKNYLDKLLKEKSGLMDDLLTGKIEVKISDSESIDV